MKQKSLTTIAFFLFAICSAFAYKADKKEYYEIKLYRLGNNEQVKRVDDFLKNAYLPALHRAGFPKVGVYHTIGIDTASDKRIYVYIPIKSLDKLPVVEDLVMTDPEIAKAGDGYWNTAFNNTAYIRIETIVLKAFPLKPHFEVPTLTGPITERVYELRSYEGGSERLYRQKVKMFNEGGEIALFKRLNFNSVFYAEVIAGSRMPNLMYLTCYNNRADRDEHWKVFGADPEWNKLKNVPEYLNTVAKNDTQLLNPAEYSEL